MQMLKMYTHLRILHYLLASWNLNSNLHVYKLEITFCVCVCDFLQIFFSCLTEQNDLNFV